MQIDEDGGFCLGSHHRCTRVSFGKVSSTVMQAKQDKKIHYSETELEEVVNKLERFVTVQPIKDWLSEELFELNC